MAWYNRGKHIFIDPTQVTASSPLDFAADTIKVALMLVAYVQDIDAHDHFDDIVANELVATGYASRGNALAGKVSNQDNTNDRGEWDATDTTFTSIGNGANGTFDEIVIDREPAAPTDANTELIASVIVSATLTNGGNITLVWATEGILHITT